MKRWQSTPEQADRTIARAVDTSPHPASLMEHMCHQVGPRPAGSPAMRDAAAVLAQVWSKLGAVDLCEEPVPLTGWQPSDSRLEVLGPDQATFDSIQAINSAAAEAEGPLVAASNPHDQTPHELRQSVRGSVVLIKGHEISGGKHIPTQQRICTLQEAGAAAIVLTSAHPTLPAIEFMFSNNPVRIPVLSISGQDGESLARLIETSPAPRIRIKTGGHSFPGECVNLTGCLGPNDPSAEIIILSAHLDSFYLSPGAFDNLTGIVTLTEIVRALAPYQDRFVRTLRTIAFTGEETGFVGSKHYVEMHARELDRIRLVLNLDGLFHTTARGMAVMWAPEIRDFVERTLQEIHPEVDVRNLFCMSSDYLPFMLQGIPTCRPADWEGPYPMWLHTRGDTADKVPIAWIRANALVYARLLFRILTDQPAFPSVPRSPEKVKTRLEREGAQELVLRWKDFTI